MQTRARRDSRRGRLRQPRRGQSLLIALALILVLTSTVVVTQAQVVGQLGLSRKHRDNERALQMAEAGANAYLNRLANEDPPVPLPPAVAALLPPLVPPSAPPGTDPISLQAFKQGVLNGTYPLIRYPAGSEQGYYVYRVTGPGSSVRVYSYGWSNGIVRRVKVDAQPYSVFEWAAIYGLSPVESFKVTGNTSIVGASGAEGNIGGSVNATFYDGPVVFAGPGAQANTAPTVSQSAPNVPSGHVGTGVLADPRVRRYPKKLSMPTADEQANRYSGSTLGVEYYRTHNNNDTGLRYLVWQSGQPSSIRELGPKSDTVNYSVLPVGSYTLGSSAWDVQATSLKATSDISGSEVIYGIRVYPGNYYLEQLDMRGQDILWLRTFTDAERATLGYTNGNLYPANPNPGLSAERAVRLWVGHRLVGSDLGSSFNLNTKLEYDSYPSRFRVYLASAGGVSIQGPPSGKFRVSLLAYNRDAIGAGYGTVTLNSGTYLAGALIAWHVDIAGGCTLEQQRFEARDGTDRLVFLGSDWTELP